MLMFFKSMWDTCILTNYDHILLQMYFVLRIEKYNLYHNMSFSFEFGTEIKSLYTNVCNTMLILLIVLFQKQYFYR